MQRLALVLVCGLTGCVDDPTQITVGVGSDDAPQSTDTPTQWPTALASPGSFSTVTVTNGASSLRVAPSGNTIWDFDALTVNATDNAQLRFFRHTVTSGEVSMLLQQGDGTANAAQVKLSGNRASYFRQPVGFGVTTPKYHIDVSAVNEKGRATSAHAPRCRRVRSAQLRLWSSIARRAGALPTASGATITASDWPEP